MVHDWRSALGERLVPAEKAVAAVESGHRVVVAMSSPWMTPFTVGKALAARAPELRGVSVDTTFTLAAMLGLLADGTRESFGTTSLFVYTDVETSRLAAHDPQADYVPMNPSFMGRLSGRRHREEFTYRYTAPDVCVVVVSPPNEAGIVSFGHHLWNARAQMRHARVVIAEVDPNLAVVPGGDNWAPVEDFTYFVEAEPFAFPAQLSETPEEEVDATQACGYYTAELIDDGDCVMFGGGAMPIRLSAFLEDKNDLGCHSEVVVPLDLVRKGVINGSRRTLARGKVSATGLIAVTDDDRQWLDGNARFELRDMEVNNDPKYIARNDNMVAVNAPLEISLWGEINVERVGPRYFRGVGGQLEFIIGALLAENGRSIHSVISKKKTAAGDWVSTIVPEFTRPGVATVPRQLADIVVTEHGVAHLMGRTERERADALIAVADPDFRPELREAAKAAFGLGRKVFT